MESNEDGTINIEDTWRSRNQKLQSDIDSITESLKSGERQLQAVTEEHNEFTETSKKEKADIFNTIQHYQKLIEERSKSDIESRRTAAQEKLAKAKREYDTELQAMVRDIQNIEHALKTREEPSETLNRESQQWGEEEEALRHRMKSIELAIFNNREAQQKAIQSAEAEALKAEAELHSFRMENDPNAGLERFSFPDSIVRQFPDYFVFDNKPGDVAAGTFRKGRSASGRIILNESDSNRINNNNNKSVGGGMKKSLSNHRQKYQQQQQQDEEDDDEVGEGTNLMMPSSRRKNNNNHNNELDQDSAVIDPSEE